MQRLIVVAPLLFLLLALPASSGAAAEREMNIYFRNAADPAWLGSQATDVNDAGEIVGAYVTSGGDIFGYMERNRVYTTIHPPGWTTSRLWEISSNGTVIGDGVTGGVSQAYTYSGGIYTPLLPPGWTEAAGRAVNDSGAAVGFDSGGDGFLYSGGAFTILQLPGATETQPQDINDGGDIVGRGRIGGSDVAFRYSSGVFTDPAPPGWTDTEAKRINDRGDILGAGDDGVRTACWLSSGGAFTTIFPPGAMLAACTDLTEAGGVLGLALYSGGAIVTYIYSDGDYYIYRDDPTNYLLPFGMNSTGTIAGWRTVDGRAVRGLVIPTVSIAANGEEGDISISGAAGLFLRLALDSWSFTGRPVDWWLIAQTPAGVFSFDAVARSWRPGFQPASMAPLARIKSLKVPGAGSARGIYTYYFGIDLKANGILDYPYWIFDRVTVFVR